MLPRSHRITTGSDYRHVVRRGIRCRGKFVILSVVALPPEQTSRFGFIVNKQVGIAVVRNGVRRRLKAICFDLVKEIDQPHEFVLRVLPAAAMASFVDLREDLLNCLTRTKVLNSVAGMNAVFTNVEDIQ